MINQLKKFLKSFYYAYNGFLIAIKEERNFRFHIVTGFYVYIFSLFYNFNKIEYFIITICIVGILSLELVNSAIERAVAQPDKNHDTYAGIAKDIAASAVLIFAIGCFVIGLFLFWDIDILVEIWRFFYNNISLFITFIVSIILSIIFIFKERK